MSAPVALRANFSNLYGSSMLPALEELFRSEIEQHPSRRSELFRMVSTDRDIYQTSAIHDMDLFSQVSEGQEYSFVRPKQGASKTFTPVKYGLGFSISEEMVDDGKFDMIALMTQKLARSAKESQEINAMNVFNNGFSTETANDGVALFSSSHTLPSGGTFRTRPTSYADLSVTSLDQALLDFETIFVGDSGIIMNMKPKILLVHPSNKRYAKELLGSELKADTANNNLNAFKDEGLRVVSSPHLTDTDAWFLLADPSETGLKIVERKGIETKAAGPDVGFATDSIYYKARYREAIGVDNAYGIYGNSGA
jgi:hypothetical protein